MIDDNKQQLILHMYYSVINIFMNDDDVFVIILLL